MFENYPLIEIYYRNHPDATIKEYLEYCRKLKENEKLNENTRYENCIEWYKNLQDRYFILNMNNVSFIALYVDKWPDTEYDNRYTCYNINIEKPNIIKDKREINRLWFKNPYEKPYYGEYYGGCKEITKEEFDSIVQKYNTIETLVKSINVK